MSNTIDMLVKLYDLPDLLGYTETLSKEGILIRRARSYEKAILLDWVERNFSKGWTSECDTCFSHMPVTAHIATKDGNIVGFSCYEATNKNFFGPIGVLDEYMGFDLGTALLLSSLHAMKEMGYAYGIIGGPTTAVDFYRKAVGAIPIAGSTPGIYIDRLAGSDS